MNLGKQTGYYALNGMAGLYNNATLGFYSGVMPGTPENGIGYQGASNTLLVPFTFSATAFPSPVFDATGYYKAQASFVANPVTPVANGPACFSHVVSSGGNALEDRTVAQPWQAGLAV
ncbi:MAG: hypothetical protein ACREFO_19150, partial [Acetobacteraceae bacterium]